MIPLYNDEYHIIKHVAPPINITSQIDAGYLDANGITWFALNPHQDTFWQIQPNGSRAELRFTNPSTNDLVVRMLQDRCTVPAYDQEWKELPPVTEGRPGFYWDHKFYWADCIHAKKNLWEIADGTRHLVPTDLPSWQQDQYLYQLSHPVPQQKSRKCTWSDLFAMVGEVVTLMKQELKETKQHRQLQRKVWEAQIKSYTQD